MKFWTLQVALGGKQVRDSLCLELTRWISHRRDTGYSSYISAKRTPLKKKKKHLMIRVVAKRINSAEEESAENDFTIAIVYFLPPT